MQSEKGRLIGEALLRDKKNARPRLVKEYRTEEERVSWEMFLGAIVFLILGVSILVNTIYFGEIPQKGVVVGGIYR